MSLTASYVTMAAAEARLEPASASDADDPRSCPHAAATCPRQRSDSAASRFVLLCFFFGGVSFRRSSSLRRRRCRRWGGTKKRTKSKNRTTSHIIIGERTHNHSLTGIADSSTIQRFRPPAGSIRIGCVANRPVEETRRSQRQFLCV